MTLPRALLIAGILLGSVFSVLAFGNPQWSGYVYEFQKYVLEKPIELPENYTGQWRTWWKGQCLTNKHYLNGQLHGKWETTSGETTLKRHYNKGMPDQFQYLYRDDQIVKISECREHYGRFHTRPMIVAFDHDAGIDRRAEFGIPVE